MVEALEEDEVVDLEDKVVGDKVIAAATAEVTVVRVATVVVTTVMVVTAIITVAAMEVTAAMTTAVTAVIIVIFLSRTHFQQVDLLVDVSKLYKVSDARHADARVQID